MEGPIAVFDSGVGGLTVVKELLKQLPNESIVYFGDTARAPYGPRPGNEVTQFSEEIVHMLQQYHPKLIVIACNTATAVALERLKVKLDIPIIGVIEPGARAALQATQTGVVAVIGTEGTIQSEAYNKALHAYDRRVVIISQACPAFVPLVEKGLYQSSQAYNAVDEAIGHMRKYPIDCLILGCTHYPFLSDIIAKVMGNNVKLIHSAEETAHEAKVIIDMLRKQSTEKVKLKTKEIVHRFMCSGELSSFRSIVEQWLAADIEKQRVEYERAALHS